MVHHAASGVYSTLVLLSQALESWKQIRPQEDNAPLRHYRQFDFGTTFRSFPKVILYLQCSLAMAPV
jgi:hypothetical protein